MGTGRHCQVGSRDRGASWGLNGSPTFRVNWLQDGGEPAPPDRQRTQGDLMGERGAHRDRAGLTVVNSFWQQLEVAGRSQGMADGTVQSQCRRYLQQQKGRHISDQPVPVLCVWPPVPSLCPFTIHPGAVTLDVFYVRDVDQELPVVPEDEQGQGPLCPLDELLSVSQGHVLTGHPVDLEGEEQEASGHSLLGKLPPGKLRSNGML